MPSVARSPRTCDSAFVHATRIQRSFVASAERQTLVWLARRTPLWINSDHLTLLGFVSQCLVGACASPESAAATLRVLR
jgi:hypothetical protein